MYLFKFVLEVLKYKQQGKTYSQINELTKISKSTISLWINNYYLNFQNLEKRYKCSHDNKIENFINTVTQEIFDFILQFLKDNPLIKMKKLLSIVNDNFSIKLTFKKLSFIFKHLKITSKKCKRVIIKDEKFLNLLIEKRKIFIELIKKEFYNKIVCIDETGIQELINSNTRGYSLRGEQINIPVSEIKIKNASIIMALTTNGIINFNITTEHVNAEIYKKIINDTTTKLQNKNYLFIFDNVSFHNDDEIFKIILNSGNRYMFTPFYSPDLNPIENVNSIIKNNTNELILGDYISANLMTNIKKEQLDNKEKNNKFNTELKIKDDERQKIIDIKNNNKLEYCDQLKEIKEDLIKKYVTNEELKISIKIKKKEILKNKNDKIKIEINNEKKKNREKFKLEKKKEESIIKGYIEKSIHMFNQKYKEKDITEIFIRAFTFDYTKIQNELKDRIQFIK